MPKTLIPAHIKAIIFDMDGVLIASEEAHYEAEYELMKRRGHDLPRELFKNYAGSSSKDIFNDLRQKFQLSEDNRSLIREKHQLFWAQIDKKITLVPGVLALVKRLQKLRYLLAVGSSADRNSIERLLEKTAIRQFFPIIVGANDVKRAKPFPDIFLEAARRLETAPANCLVIEDSKKGVQAAKSAGMYVIGFRNIASGNQDLSQADAIIDNFRQIVSLRELITAVPSSGNETRQETDS